MHTRAAIAAAAFCLLAAEPALAQQSQPASTSTAPSAIESARRFAAACEWARVEAVLQPLESSENDEAIALLARARAAQGKTTAAIEHLKAALERKPKAEVLWLARADIALAAGQPAVALEVMESADARIPVSAEMYLRLAQAYDGLGEFVGRLERRQVPGGRVGQFSGDWLLLEASEGAEWFSCAPRTSAIYQVRKALDGGCDSPDAHLLHAEIWAKAGKPALALAILRARESVLLDPRDPGRLAAMGRIVLAANQIDDFLRYEQMRAELSGAAGDGIRAGAYRTAADRYGRAGDDRAARRLLRQALDLLPSDAGLRLNLADAEWEAENRTEAVRLYRGVLEAAPSHPDRRRILERLGE